METCSMILLFGIIHKLAQYFVKKILKNRKKNSLELQQILVALAGPVINLIIVVVIQNIKVDIFTGIMITTVNLILILFSLIPIYPMAGGKILQAILKILIGEEKGEQYTNKISFAILILITIISSIAILYLENVWILLGVVYLWYRYCKQIKNIMRKY